MTKKNIMGSAVTKKSIRSSNLIYPGTLQCFLAFLSFKVIGVSVDVVSLNDNYISSIVN